MHQPDGENGQEQQKGDEEFEQAKFAEGLGHENDTNQSAEPSIEKNTENVAENTESDLKEAREHALRVLQDYSSQYVGGPSEAGWRESARVADELLVDAIQSPQLRDNVSVAEELRHYRRQLTQATDAQVSRSSDIRRSAGDVGARVYASGEERPGSDEASQTSKAIEALAEQIERSGSAVGSVRAEVVEDLLKAAIKCPDHIRKQIVDAAQQLRKYNAENREAAPVEGKSLRSIAQSLR